MVSRMLQQAFAESQTTAYDAYQQSWRWLGVYVDCKVYEADDGEDQVEGDEHCQRYMLWAAYVDPKYENFGVHEYQYHDPVDGWNTVACTEDSPCRKLDCHESGTNMQLLGIYKESYFSSEWFEQLFKHAGFCLWDEDTYGFMQTNYGAWPEQCTATGIAVTNENEDSDSISLYMDLKPGPSLELGLYTDKTCSTEYDKGDEAMVSLISTSLGFVSPRSSSQAFQVAMDVYKSCQPCRTLNLKGSEQFSCYDDAGYTNVNQCMKFRTHTTMEPATWNDIQAAAIQGALTDIVIGDRIYENKYQPSNRQGAGFLLLSGMVAVATWVFVHRRDQYRVNNKALAEPLVQEQQRRGKRHRVRSTATSA